MALINCSECRTEISKTAATCPKCGNSIRAIGAGPVGRKLGGAAAVFFATLIAATFIEGKSADKPVQGSTAVSGGAVVLQAASSNTANTAAQTPAPTESTPPAAANRVAETAIPPASVPTTAMSAGAAKPSFDCAHVHSTPERLICGNPELAAHDRDLAVVFARARAAANDQAAFKEQERQRWNYRERTCRDKDCLVRWYADQKADLTQIAATGNVPGS